MKRKVMPVKEFKGKKINIRSLDTADLKRAKDFQCFINSLIGEDAKLLINRKQSLKDEKEWIKGETKNIKAKKTLCLVAESEGKIIANANISLEKYRKAHIGEFGICIKNGWRGMGLGGYLMARIIEMAKKDLKPKPKFIKLGVFANNKPAIGLYEKMGFRAVSRVPKQFQYKGKLIDEIVMLLRL
ncbi:MAG: GNAT family N-acetyltransferase [Candidatus Pacebacteria bacterium]|nr:GNAT family N-acetyltransferase [Candidatus Paceibacterota bacterium]